jgi:hypothetical protein
MVALSAPTQAPLFARKTCDALGDACSPARQALVLPFVAGGLCILLAIAEAGYVLSKHGKGGLRHGLPFLAALAPIEGVNPLPYRAPEEGQTPPGYTKARELAMSQASSPASTAPSSWAEHKAAIVRHEEMP